MMSARYFYGKVMLIVDWFGPSCREQSGWQLNLVARGILWSLGTIQKAQDTVPKDIPQNQATNVTTAQYSVEVVP